MIHKLKTWPSCFQAVKAKIKPFEIRVNDRNYQVGDTLILEEFSPCSECLGTRKVATPGGGGDREECGECLGMPDGGIYTGDTLVRTVSYITDFGQTANRIVMGLSENALHELPPPCGSECTKDAHGG